MKRDKRPLRLWKRDNQTLDWLRRAPYSVSQMTVVGGFPNKKETSERLKRYFDAGLVLRTYRPLDLPHGKGELIYWAKPTGRVLVKRDEYHGADRCRMDPSHWGLTQIHHQMLVNDSHVALHTACRAVGHLECEFTHLPRTDGLKAHHLVPDGMIVIRHTTLEKRLLHFLEADMATEPLAGDGGSSLQTKFGKYVEYFDSGASQNDFPWANGFRVLLVTNDEERVLPSANRADGCGAAFVLTAVAKALTADQVLGEVWTSTAGQKVPLVFQREKESGR